MHLQCGMDNTSATKLLQFAQWILDIPNKFLITNYDEPIVSIMQSTYLNLIEHYNDEDFLHFKTILASTIETVDQIMNMFFP